MFFYALILIFLPFILFVSGVPNTSHLLMFVSIGVCASSLIYNGSIWIRVFIFYCGLHFIFKIIIDPHNFSIFPYLLYFYAGVSWLLFIKSLCNNKNKNNIINILIITISINIFLAYLQLAGVPVYKLYTNISSGEYNLTGMFGNPEYLALHCAAVCPLLIFNKYLKYLILFPIFIIFKSSCFGVFFALIISLFLMIRIKNKILIIPLILSLLILFNIYFNNDSEIINNGRWGVWYSSLSYFFNNNIKTILFGFGPSFQFTEHEYHYYLHNDYLLVLMKYGIVGLFFIFLFIYKLLKYKTKYSYSLMIYLLFALSNNVIQIALSAMFFIILLVVSDHKELCNE